MGSKLFRAFSVAAVGALFATMAFAHHGAGAYDTGKTVTVTGSVTQFRFINPHVLIYANVTGDDGSVVEWSGELTSPNRLARGDGNVKWTKDILQPGDKIELTGNPARNGAPTLRLQKVVKYVDGKPVVLIGHMKEQKY
jgi:hypothetical protein